MEVQVDVQVDETATHDFVGVGRLFQVLLAVVPGADAQRLAAVDAERVLPVTDREPADVAAVAVVLRMDVFGLVFREGHSVASQESAALAVGIVLPGAAAIVLDVGEVGRQPHPHAELGHHGLAGAGGKVVHVDPDAPLVEDGVIHRNAIDGLLPDGGALGEPGRVLVVVFRLPEIRFEGRLQHLAPVDDPGGEGVSVQGDALGRCPAGDRGRLGEGIGREHELLARHGESFLRPGFVLLQAGGDVQQALSVDGNGIPRDLIFVDVRETVVVDHADVIPVPDELQGLIDIPHLVVVGMRRPVGRQQPVDAERPVGGLVAEIAAVSPVFDAVLLLQQPLVHPVPDGGAADGRIGIDDVPILLQVAHRIAHGVGIFAHDEGTVVDPSGLRREFFGREVAVVVDRRVLPVGVAEGRGVGIEGEDGFVHRLHVAPHAAFVAQAPHNDAGVVLVALHQRNGPVHMGRGPVRIVSDHAVAPAVTVALLVGLVHHVEAVAVAEFVEVFPVGIVAGAQEVDVRLFHQRDVLLVGGVIDIPARHRMVIVAVHPAQFDLPAVEPEDFPDAFDLLHAQVIVEMLDDAAPAVGQFDAEGVEVGLFRRPEPRPVDPIRQPDVRGIPRREFLQRSLDRLSVDLEDRFQIPGVFPAGVAEGDIGRDLRL